jgi:hypothetical protein
MICITCSQDQPEDKFKIRSDTGRRRTECNSCVVLRSTEWNKRNKKRRAEINHKNYAKTIGKDPEECRRSYALLTAEVRLLTYYQRHTEEVRKRVRTREKREHKKISAYNKARYERDKPWYAARNRNWRKNNPVKMNEYTAKRRAADKRAQPKWLNAIQRAQIQEMYDIASAKNMQTGIRHHVDHMFALRHPSFCGLHVPWNLRVITESENCSKRLKVPKEFERMLFEAA